MSGKVKWFSSENFGAPELTNDWGRLTTLLDAVLVTGYGAQDVESITVENNIMAVNFARNHNIQQYQWVELSGTNTDLDGEHKVLAVTPTSIELIAELQDQTITGAISCKIASMGWTKPFSGENKGVYQAKDTITNPFFLRVDDSYQGQGISTGAKFGRVGILESCTDIDDISGAQVPYDATNPTKNWIDTATYKGWSKWYYATSVSSIDTNANDNGTPSDGVRRWVIVGNKDSFWFLPSIMVEASNSTAWQTCFALGFGVTQKRDIYYPFLSSRTNYVAVTSSGRLTSGLPFNNNLISGVNFLKNPDGIVAPTEGRVQISGTTSASTFSGTNVYAVESDGSILFSSMRAIGSQSPYAYLGDYPIIKEVYTSLASRLYNEIIEEGGRVYLIKKCPMSTAYQGGYMFDLGEIL